MPSLKLDLYLLLLPFVLVIGAGAAQPLEERPPHPQFTVLGRWSDPKQLTYRIEIDGAPARLGVKPYVRLVKEAFAAWEARGRVQFREALMVEDAHITLSWREGAHDDCPPFIGWCGTLAHTGPIGKSTFVHFNRAAAWSEKGPEFNSFYATALHEIGHTLGLDHSPQPKALMHSVPDATKNAITSFDWLGLESLYGSEPSQLSEGRGDGDVQWLRFDRKGNPVPLGNPVLRVAPAGRIEVALLDINGEQPPELVTWPRNVGDRSGGLSFYSFDTQGLLVRSIGPAFALTFPEYQISFAHTEEGVPVMIHVLPDQRYRAVEISKKGLPVKPLFGKKPLRLDNGLRDEDADGTLEVAVTKAPQPDESILEIVRKHGSSEWTYEGRGCINTDAIPDILLQHTSGTRHRWLLSSPETPQTPWHAATPFPATHLLLHDINTDGTPEALAVFR